MKQREIALKDKIDLEGNFNTHDITRNAFMLKGNLAKEGYDWWWHSFTGRNAKTGEEKAFFIEFFTINPELGGAEPVFGQLEENKANGIKPSYLMVKAGCWGKDARQLHRFFGWEKVTVSKEVPYKVEAEDCFCTETETRGSISLKTEEVSRHPQWMCDAGSMQWNLKMEKKVAFNVGYGAGKALRDAQAFEMYWHAEGMKTLYEGEIFLDGEKYIVEKENSYGYADKNWGSNFTSPWIWISSNHLRSRLTGEWLQDTVFDIGGGRPKIGPVSLEGKLLGAMWYEGEPFEFNFSKFWTLTKTRFECKETEKNIIWKIIQTTPIAKMETRLSCPKKDMLLVNYEAPDGSRKHTRLWNGGTGKGRVRLFRKELLLNDEKALHKLSRKWVLVDDMDVFHAGCEYGEYEQTDVKYRFWGHQNATVAPISEEYKGIRNPKDLYDALSHIWCADTCAPRMRSNWTEENKTMGQCSITAFLAQDIFGGKVYGILRDGGNYHCYNVIGDCAFDLTSEQFGNEKLDYTDNPQQFREVHFSKEEKRLRYEYLKEKLREYCE